jgi:hypothetical protein
MSNDGIVIIWLRNLLLNYSKNTALFFSKYSTYLIYLPNFLWECNPWGYFRPSVIRTKNDVPTALHVWFCGRWEQMTETSSLIQRATAWFSVLHAMRTAILIFARGKSSSCW